MNYVERIGSKDILNPKRDHLRLLCTEYIVAHDLKRRNLPLLALVDVKFVFDRDLSNNDIESTMDHVNGAFSGLMNLVLL